MKIEIGESLMLSWLRHIKKCKLVQNNWKPSVSCWELENKVIIEKLMMRSSEYFRDKYEVELYKKTVSCMQLLQQAEIDAIGIGISNNNEQEIHAIDVAFHEAGLNYGDKNETATRIVKKIIRTAMCLIGYFPTLKGNIYFTSPKINNNILELLNVYLEDIKIIFKEFNLNYNVILLANSDFSNGIMESVINISTGVADTSELFLRSIQLYNMLGKDRKIKRVTNTNVVNVTNTHSIVNDENHVPVGKFVYETLTKMFRNEEISIEEVEKMQTSEYSKLIFDIQYPLLKEVESNDASAVKRYWKKGGPIQIYGKRYFICSEWYENSGNNDRAYFMSWLEKKERNKNK